MLKRITILFSVLAILGACRSKDPLTIEPGGALQVQVYLDRDGDLSLDQNIDRLPVGLSVAVMRLTGAVVATAQTDAAGIAFFPRIPVGTYNLALSTAAAGDSLVLAGPGPHRAIIVGDAGSSASLPLEYPLVTATGIQTMQVGRPLVARGTALHQSNLFGDSILHIRDATGAARLVIATPGGGAATLGDEVRVVGRTGISRGRPAIVDAHLFVVQAGAAPAPRLVSTGTANSADAAKMDSDLVEVRNAAVVSHGQVGTAPAMEVTDGSGNVIIVFEPSVVQIQGQWLPFEQVDLIGVLVPVEPGRWALKPRSNADVKRQ